MKRIVLCIAVMLATTVGSNAQWLDFANNKDHYSIGFNIGQVGTGTNYKSLGFGASIEAWGVYIDYIGAGPEHQFDNHVGEYTWEDSVSWALNIGYQIPVLPWLRVMPLLGYSQTNNGLTYGNTLNIETNENSSNLYHDYKVISGSRKHSFNFGCGIVIQPIEYFNIYAVYTRRAIYGGISLNLHSLVK